MNRIQQQSPTVITDFMQNAYRLFLIVKQFPSFFRRMTLKVIIWC
jgi:hypothetical protein